MHQTGKNLLILYAEEPLEIHRGPTPDQEFRFVKGYHLSQAGPWQAILKRKL